MAEPLAPAAAPRPEDLEQLRLLSIFHYVVAALVALLASIPLIHFTVGTLLTAGVFPVEPGEEVGARVAGWMLMGCAGAVILAGWAVAVGIAATGRFLAARERWTFCVVVAALECLITPFGTVLGVFTLVVLMRDSVRALFGRPAAAGGAG